MNFSKKFSNSQVSYRSKEKEQVYDFIFFPAAEDVLGN